MNRTERRRKGITDKVRTYTLTDEQIIKIKSEAIKEASEEAMIKLMGLPLITLRDKFDFEGPELELFLDQLLSEYDCFEKGYVSLEDLQNTIYEETGVRVSRST